MAHRGIGEYSYLPQWRRGDAVTYFCNIRLFGYMSSVASVHVPPRKMTGWLSQAFRQDMARRGGFFFFFFF